MEEDGQRRGSADETGGMEGTGERYRHGKGTGAGRGGGTGTYSNGINRKPFRHSLHDRDVELLSPAVAFAANPFSLI